MDASRKPIQSIPVDQLHIHPDLNPKEDENLLHLWEKAVKGKIPVYFAAVPLGLCVPFDLDYRPDLHPVGLQAIQQYMKLAQQDRPQPIWVYPRGKWFIVSDHYIELFAALQGMRDCVPCWVLGKPDNDLVRDVQGPVSPTEVKKLIFGG